ncbi:hypothetical protein LJR153_007148 [Paenibacillus sp. LjRoot153]|uniref:hypothetical protein n=1 Tax=Paenibacillus sp. LjRoot153 TaxID=3342270 RepID=UPI003ED156AC
MNKKIVPILALTLMMTLAGCKSSGTTNSAVNASESPQSIEAATATPQVTVSPNPSKTPIAGTSNKPTKVAMTGVTAIRLADAKVGWIGGNGWIAHTTDSGKQWQVQYEGSGEIKQLFALNGQEAWASIGDEGKLLSTKDGGQHWTSAGRVPNTAAFFHFISKSEAFSGNAHTVDGGLHWTNLPVPDGITGDAYFRDAKNGWAVKPGKDTVDVLRTQDGGKTWNRVMSRKNAASLTGTVIRSAGENDAWIELIGGSGMNQTSYSLFHTKDGGKTWQTVLANSTAGGGIAPGFPVGDNTGPKNTGAKPGPLYVVSPDVAFMGGQCLSCDKPNSIGLTKDGGKTWENGKETFTGYGELLLGMADANQGWLITNDNTQPSVMYTTSSGGANWAKAHNFDAPK